MKIIFLLFFCSQSFGYEFNVKYVSNYDGDTFMANIDGVPDLLGKRIPIRIERIDTPEIKSSNECERRVANEAKVILFNLLSSAKQIKLINVKRDKYFRLDAEVLADGVNVSDELLSKKVAVEYGNKVNWCKYK